MSTATAAPFVRHLRKALFLDVSFQLWNLVVAARCAVIRYQQVAALIDLLSLGPLIEGDTDIAFLVGLFVD